MWWTMLRGGHVFDPADRGIADVLIVGEKIAAVGPDLPLPTGIGKGEVLDVRDRVVLPGLIDGHIHFQGSTGTGGPLTRTTDLQIERITRAGVTTVVTPLGTDNLSRTVQGLIQRAAALEAEGISAYCYTGGWRNPVPAVTGDPQADVAFISRVVGIKVAISESTSPVFSLDELCRLAHAAHVGGRLAGKGLAGKGAVLHAHIGSHSDGLKPLQEVQRRTGIPPDRLVATHVNRYPGLLRQAIDYAVGGGSIDVTGTLRPEDGYPEAIRASAAIREAVAAGVPPARITLSSDGGAAFPLLKEAGRAVGQYMPGPESVLQAIHQLVREGMTWGQAVSFATSHVADLLGFRRKGRIAEPRQEEQLLLVSGVPVLFPPPQVAEAFDADLLLLSSAGEVDRVYCRGCLLVQEGKAIVRGPFGG